MLKNRLSMASGFILLCLLLVIPMLYSPDLSKAQSPPDSLPEYSSPKEITQPLNSSPTIYDGAAGVEDGNDVLYTTSKSVPAQFSVIDLETKEVLRTLPMEGANDSWHHEVAPDGTVYVTGGRYLWGYSPDSKEINQLARIPDNSLWALTVDENSNAYIGTYSTGSVFKYDKETEDLHDYGRMIGESDQEYVRSIGYNDGFIYAGTAHDKIMRVNLETGEKNDIAGELNETGTVYDLDIVDDRYLFARYKDSKAMYVYDLQKNDWLDVQLTNVAGLHTTDSLNGNVYFVADNTVKYLNMETLEITETSMEYSSGFRGVDWVEIEGDEQLPGKSLVTVTFSGSIVFFNMETEEVVTYSSIVPPTPNVTNEIFSYSEDKMYISGMTGGTGALYNPQTGDMESFNIGQGDTVHAFDNNVYFGVYPAGKVQMIDPEANPAGPATDLFTIGNEQQRLHTMTDGDGKLFVGSIPTYGNLGGALTVYDGETHEVFRNVVEDQSVNGLAFKDGKVYGSTTINGGLGSTPTAEEAKLFVWDPDTEQKTKEVSLNIEGLNNPEHIGDLTNGKNDEYIWGGSTGYIFALDPETLEVVKSVEVNPDPAMSAWDNVHLEWSDNGFLYANSGGNLYVINPDTLEFKYLTRTVSFDIGEDGDIYFSPYNNRTFLSKIEVIDYDYTWEPLDVGNPSFEEGFEEWVSMFDTGEEYRYEVTTEESHTGNQSLKVYDQTRNNTVAVHSDPIPIKPGKEYLSEVMMNLTSGTPSLLVRIYDKDGNQVQSEATQVKTGYGEWQKVQQKILAPSDGDYARVFALSTNYSLTEGYFDDFALYERVRTSEQLQEISLDVENTELTRGESTNYSVTGTLGNGEEVQIDEADIFSSDDDVLLESDGKLIAKNPGQATVHAKVEEYGNTYESSPIEVQVEVTLESLESYLQTSYEKDKIPHPIYKKSYNHLKQAVHHLENGRPEQSDHQLEVMQHQLNKWTPDNELVKENLLNDLDFYLSK
ncbi:carbohydrate binding domain-containing protein [Thalassobacillus sp. CUG 92003]|uniref:carbohydrate binding domain-containing protein n=1 Tax=Thalassobacillus sp. CUG 92003 TaxID=2736641 RepID=UPI0021024A14|nr:carbohydrate binding domain-containing protein [Thalassobacillus sp. CUG 92003]